MRGFVVLSVSISGGCRPVHMPSRVLDARQKPPYIRFSNRLLKRSNLLKLGETRRQKRRLSYDVGQVNLIGPEVPGGNGQGRHEGRGTLVTRNRRSIRLRGYDYSRAGAYFVTVCTQNRTCLFGEIADNQMILNDVGRMVERWWNELNNKFSQSTTDKAVVMPNHVHGIVVIDAVGARRAVPLPERFGKPAPNSGPIRFPDL